MEQMTDDELMEMLKGVLDEAANNGNLEFDSIDEGIPIHMVITLMSMPPVSRKGNIIMLMLMDFYNHYGEDPTRHLIEHMSESLDKALED
jgi:hypothetical protein